MSPYAKRGTGGRVMTGYMYVTRTTYCGLLLILRGRMGDSVTAATCLAGEMSSS